MRKEGVEVATNCLSVDTAAAEMDALSAENPRVKDPLYHLVISWMEGESPSPDQAFEAVAYTLKQLGFEGHQFVAAIHRDTENVHTHVMVNRVNPESLRAVSPSNDYYVMDRSMRELEIRQGWGHAPGPYVVVERNGQKIVERAKASEGAAKKDKRRPAGAERMEESAGEESLHTFVRGAPRKAVLALFKTEGVTWAALHQELAKHQLALRRKGQGLAIHSLTAPDVTPVKASSMHEDLSLGRLEKRLGAFEPWDPSLAPAPVPVPDAADEDVTSAPASPEERQGGYTPGRELDAIDERQPRSKRDPEKREARKQARAEARRDLKQRYQEYVDRHVVTRLSKDEVGRRLRELAASVKQRRERIKAQGGPAPARKMLYSLLALDAAKERIVLMEQIAKERAALKADPQNQRLSYKDWVHEQAKTGDEAAVAQLRGWAYADQRARKNLDEIEANEAAPGMSPEYVSATMASFVFTRVQALDVRRSGAVVYWHGHQRAFIDYGRVVRMATDRIMDDARVLAALTFARQKFGGSFKLTGSDAFKAKAIELIARNNLDIKLKDPEQHSALQQAKQRHAPRGPRG
nr:TraI/MobA(P) family conjugative relaxase [Dyella ginsengisoli]